jgi:SAM-dependent methyltransferase
MDHQDHLELIRDGVSPGGVWGEFGSGSGHFTLALAELLGAQGVIYSVDKNRRALETQKRRLEVQLTGGIDPEIHYIHADFTRYKEIPPLDGVLMANSLHFYKGKEMLLVRILHSLVSGGRFILVEYNTDLGNPWVPHPVSYATWQLLASQIGFVETRLLHRVPSSFLGEIYSALSVREDLPD